MTLLIALPAPQLPGGADAGAMAALPELPALTRLLRQARRLRDASHWRAGVLEALGGDTGIEPAAVAAAALPALPAGTALCLAAPLHVVAGISRVHLPPGGVPAFAPGEEQALLAAFNAEFGGPDVSLHAVAPGGAWLLAAPFAAAARDLPPEELAGEALARAAASEPAQRALRRFGAEVEMWLAAHALNRARERRGQPPFNTLWLWGGAHAAPLPRLRPVSIIAAAGAADAWLTGLAGHTGTPVRQVADWQQLRPLVRDACASAADLALAVPASGFEAAASHGWQQLEQDWFVPLLRDLAAGTAADVQLQLGRGRWRLRAARWPRWPTRRNWWQMAGEVRA